MKGRKPKPTAIKKQDGNPGRRPFNTNEPIATPGLPDCPDHLDDEARAEWHRTGAQLVKEKRMSPTYKAAFAAYCVAWSRWVMAEKKVQEFGPVHNTPNGFLQSSPYLTIANQAFAQVMKALTELGISPTSQARVAAVKEPATVSRLDAFLINGRKNQAS